MNNTNISMPIVYLCYIYITPTKQMVNFNINIIAGKYTSEVAMNWGFYS